MTEKQKKYLIVAPSWIGDMVMSQSLYRLLKMKYPECIIDLLVPKPAYELGFFMPEVNEVILAPFKHKQFDFNLRKQIGKSLKNKAYTDCIILPNSWKSALTPFFAKIKKRTGFKGESRYILLNDLHRLDKLELPTMSERFCALGIKKDEVLDKNLPEPKLVVDESKIEETLKKFNLDQIQNNHKIIAFAPGAEFGEAKRWPEKYFAQIATKLIEKDYVVLLLGGKGDQVITQKIVNFVGNISSTNHLIDLAGKTTISEVVHILSSVDGILANDTGLMHIANSFSKPTLVIYGSSSSGFTPPLNKNATSIYLKNLPCRPCFKRTCPLGHMNCLNQLTPEVVFQKFELDVLAQIKLS